jgi:hypothetical protein
MTAARAAWSLLIPELTSAARSRRKPKIMADARIAGRTEGGLGLAGR